MRIGLLADAHGNVAGLRAALTALDSAGCDQILFAGDAVGYYPEDNEVISLLSDRTVAVMGNHDRMLVRPSEQDKVRWPNYALDRADARLTQASRRWLEQQPPTRHLSYSAGTVLLCHGTPWSDSEYLFPDSSLEHLVELDADYVIAGHTHVPMSRNAGRVRVINPGSCGQPRDYIPGACAAVLDLTTGGLALLRQAYDVAAYVEGLARYRLPSDFANILLRTRDTNRGI
jgi:putative phosphoesterase